MAEALFPMRLIGHLPRRCAACPTSPGHASCADERIALLRMIPACPTHSWRSTCAAVLLEPLESPPLRPPRADPLLRFSLEQVVTPSFMKPYQRPRAPRALYPDDKSSGGWHAYDVYEIVQPTSLKSTLSIPRARECSRGTRRALTIPTTHPAPLCPPRAPAHAPCGSRALAPLAGILWVRCAHLSEGAARDVLGLREPKRVRSASPVPGAHEGVRQVRVRGRSPERSRCMRVACAFGRRGSDALYAV